MALLGYRNDKNPDQLDLKCGGTLITDYHVLTTAQCASKESLYLVKINEINIVNYYDNKDYEEIEIVEKYFHPNFDKSSLKNDVAILKLKYSPMLFGNLFLFK